MLHLTTNQLQIIADALATTTAPDHPQDVLDTLQAIKGELAKRQQGIDLTLLKTRVQSVDPLILAMERNTPRCSCCGVQHEHLVRGMCSHCIDEGSLL